MMSWFFAPLLGVADKTMSSRGALAAAEPGDCVSVEGRPARSRAAPASSTRSVLGCIRGGGGRQRLFADFPDQRSEVGVEQRTSRDSWLELYGPGLRNGRELRFQRDRAAPINGARSQGGTIARGPCPRTLQRSARSGLCFSHLCSANPNLRPGFQSGGAHAGRVRACGTVPSRGVPPAPPIYTLVTFRSQAGVLIGLRPPAGPDAIT